jgi:uncharacterized protein HemX
MALPWLAFAALSAGTTLFTAKQQQNVGKQQQKNLNRQAEQEQLQADQQEVSRREKLNQVLAADAAANSGLMNTESTALALNNAKNASYSESVESLSDRMRQDLLKREGRAARSAGNINAASTLLTGGLSIAREF